MMREFLEKMKLLNESLERFINELKAKLIRK